MGLLRKWTDILEQYDPLFKAGKKATYGMVKQDSDNMEGIGRAIGWDWLTEEAQRNQKNPGRAIGKAAVTAATIYGGGLLGGAGAGAGSAAGNAAGAGVSGVGPVASGTAYDAALLAAQQAAGNGAVQSGNAAANGLLGYGGELASVGDANAAGGLLGGSSPTNAGIAHNTAFDAIRYSNGFADAAGNIGRWATDGAKSPMGMSGKDAQLGMQGLQMMQPQQEPQRPAPPPPPAAPPPQSSFTGYGMANDPFAGMTDEQKRKLLAMMQQQGGMR